MLPGRFAIIMSQVNPVNKSFCLEQICESNYHKFLRLIPDLYQIKTSAIGQFPNKPSLHLKIIERSAYTLTVQLTHCFMGTPDELIEPAVKIRLYLDAKLAEVLRDHSRIDVFKAISDTGQSKKIMDYKWSLNYFLSKWLDYCLQTDYRFKAEVEEIA